MLVPPTYTSGSHTAGTYTKGTTIYTSNSGSSWSSYSGWDTAFEEWGTTTPTNPVPTTTNISSTTRTVGDGAFTLTVNGTNFLTSSVVRFAGTAKTTTYVSATQLTAAIPASDLTTAGTYNITVFNPTPGGGTSNAQLLTVNNPLPTTTIISPTTNTVGDAAFTVTVNGTNFLPSSVVNFGGSARTTTFVSATQLTAAIPASDLINPGTYSITVVNPAPGGGTSNSQSLIVNNPLPTTSGISPATKTAGDAPFTVTVNGTNFLPSSAVSINGSARTTTFISSTQLAAAIPASDLTAAGAYNITVFNPIPGGGTSNAQAFTVEVRAANLAPTTSSISPATKTAGDAAFTLTVNGTNFFTSSVVRFGGSDRITTCVSETQLTAAIPASDLINPGTFDITVFNPAPGGGTSNAQSFTINLVINNPVPTTTGISPTTKAAGDSAFTLTVNGTNFLTSSVVRFAGTAKTTTYVSATQLTAAIPASDLTTAGTYNITVFTPTPGGGISNAQVLTINSLVPSVNQGPMITFRFDDGHISQYNYAFPVLSSAGFAGTAYCTTDAPNDGGWGSYVTWDDIVQLYQAGWEIGSHTIDHQHLTSLSDSQLISELGDSKADFLSHGIPVKSFSSPYGDYNNHVLSFVAKYYESHSSAGPDNLDAFPFDDYRVSVREIVDPSSTPVSTVQSWVDEAASSKKWLVLLMHVLVQSNPGAEQYTVQDFQTIVDYVKAKNIPVVTISEGLKVLNQNLVPNSSFESAAANWADSWSRSDTVNVVLDTGTNGSAPNPQNSLKITGGSSINSASSSLFSINPGRPYILKGFFNCQDYTSGSVSFSIEEYALNGNLISKKTQASLNSQFVGNMNSVYTPSANTANVRVVVAAAAGSSLTCYIDRIVLADSSTN